MTDFERIEKAILYIRDHFKLQPDLDEVARQVHMSPFHFQRMFKEWAGVSPKKFLQYISLGHAKQLLKEQHSLADASFETGLSGTGRLHDLFISIESMTPGEFKQGGEGLEINYQFAETPFGRVLMASTPKGICYMAFTDRDKEGLEELKSHFPRAGFHHAGDEQQQRALHVFQLGGKPHSRLTLHLKGTPFQLKVWEALLRIPTGNLTTYAKIAASIGAPGASRAVGTAVAGNPVAYLIPCHRVIRSTGVLGEYHWGAGRKTAMIGWEGVWSQESGVGSR
ncbi:MAG TPA: methylated-DNA--[protein]-cysteine S-methyltransferase [Puia sp.]|nr:methylated-DNA--[protein]-cysteine S-methyltransferase [Puia sp.]